MKRTIIALLAVAAAVMPSVALTPDQLIKRFRSAENAEYVHVPKFLIKMGLSQAGNDIPFSDNLTGVTVLNLSGTSASVRQKFTNAVDEISGYETLLTTNDGDDKVLILTKAKGENYQDFVIIAVDSSDCSIVKLAGDFSQKEINEMIASKTK